jgi:hypothetical protein
VELFAPISTVSVHQLRWTVDLPQSASKISHWVWIIAWAIQLGVEVPVRAVRADSMPDPRLSHTTLPVQGSALVNVVMLPRTGVLLSGMSAECFFVLLNAL